MKYPDAVLNSPVIRRRLAIEGAYESQSGDGSKGHYWAVTLLPSNRTLVGCQNYEPSTFDIDPHPMQKTFAEELMRSLHRHVGHDGGWIVGFTHPPAHGNVIRVDGDNVFARLFCLWLDEDGDPQFTYESDVPFYQMVNNTTDYYVKMCDEAYGKWAEMLGKVGRKDLGLTDGQMTKAAQASLG